MSSRDQAGRSAGVGYSLVAIGTTDEGASLDSLEVPYGFGDVLKGGPRGSVSAFGVVHHWVASIAVLRLST